MNPTSTPIGSNLTAGTLTPKAWADKTIDEKVEALRYELRDFRYLITRVHELEKRARLLESHAHVDGKVVSPIIDYCDGANAVPGMRDRLA